MINHLNHNLLALLQIIVGVITLLNLLQLLSLRHSVQVPVVMPLQLLRSLELRRPRVVVVVALPHNRRQTWQDLVALNALALHHRGQVRGVVVSLSGLLQIGKGLILY